MIVLAQNPKNERHHYQIQYIRIGLDSQFPWNKVVTLVKNTVTIYLHVYVTRRCAEILRTERLKMFHLFGVGFGVVLGHSRLFWFVPVCSGWLRLVRGSYFFYKHCTKNEVFH